MNRTTLAPTNTKELLATWHLHALKSRERHFTSAIRLERRSRWLGVPAVILSGIVGTTVFATLQEQQVPGWARIIVGLVSVAAAVLAGLQTFLRYPERSDKHRTVGTKYKSLVREFEYLQSQPLDTIPDLGEQLKAVKDRFDALETEAPLVSQRVWLIVESEFDETPNHAMQRTAPRSDA